MHFVISPAKSLDFETPAPIETASQPRFLDRSAALIETLRPLSPADLAKLMDISDPLAVLNVTRYADWRPEHAPGNAKQAVLAFNGDVYEGLDAASLSAADLAYAQDHLRILSGLYGVLRPLDLIHPYRLEMGTKLANPGGKDLYAFWGETLTDSLNAELAQAPAGSAALVNLASEEYFKAVKPKKLAAPVIDCVFEDWKGGKYKIISFYAKRARGLMARYAITNRIDRPEGLKGFDLEGYGFDADASEARRLVFRRRLEG